MIVLTQSWSVDSNYFILNFIVETDVNLIQKKADINVGLFEYIQGIHEFFKGQNKQSLKQLILKSPSMISSVFV